MKKLIFILSISLLLTSCATLPTYSHDNIWNECESPECHYEEINIRRKACDLEPITHNCEKCISHKCFEYYYLTDENGDVVFIGKDKFTKEVCIYFKATNSFIHDVIESDVGKYYVDDEGEWNCYCYWVLKCASRIIKIDYVNETFDIR